MPAVPDDDGEAAAAGTAGGRDNPLIGQLCSPHADLDGRLSAALASYPRSELKRLALQAHLGTSGNRARLAERLFGSFKDHTTACWVGGAWRLGPRPGLPDDSDDS